MFNQESDGKGGVRLRNSWGHAQEWLDVPASRVNDIDSSYIIHIKELVKHNMGADDEVLCKNYKWVGDLNNYDDGNNYDYDDGNNFDYDDGNNFDDYNDGNNLDDYNDWNNFDHDDWNNFDFGDWDNVDFDEGDYDYDWQDFDGHW